MPRRTPTARSIFALAEQAEPELVGANQGVWLDRLEVEHDNLRVALARSLALVDGEGALRLAAALGRFWRVRGYLAEGSVWLERALAAGEGAPAAVPRQSIDRRRRAHPCPGRHCRVRRGYSRLRLPQRATTIVSPQMR